jgi:hypothetical protein
MPHSGIGWLRKTCSADLRKLPLGSVVNRIILPSLNRREACGKAESNHQGAVHPYKRNNSIPGVLALLSELNRLASSHRGRLHPGFRRFGHPPRRRISLQCQLGNLHWQDFHIHSLHCTIPAHCNSYRTAKATAYRGWSWVNLNLGKGTKDHMQPAMAIFRQGLRQSMLEYNLRWQIRRNRGSTPIYYESQDHH